MIMILSLIRLFSLFLSSGGASDSADEEQVRVNSTRYGNQRESRLSKNQSDYVNDPHPSDGMKSKSPVSLEIRLPSTAGKMTLYSVSSNNFMNHDTNTGHLSVIIFVSQPLHWNIPVGNATWRCLWCRYFKILHAKDKELEISRMYDSFGALKISFSLRFSKFSTIHNQTI